MPVVLAQNNVKDGRWRGLTRGRQEVGGGDAVFELRSRHPLALRDAKLAQQGDVGRRLSGAYTADARPSPRYGGEGHGSRALPTGSRPLSSATRRPVANWHNCR